MYSLLNRLSLFPTLMLNTSYDCSILKSNYYKTKWKTRFSGLTKYLYKYYIITYGFVTNPAMIRLKFRALWNVNSCLVLTKYSKLGWMFKLTVDNVNVRTLKQFLIFTIELQFISYVQKIECTESDLFSSFFLHLFKSIKQLLWVISESNYHGLLSRPGIVFKFTSVMINGMAFLKWNLSIYIKTHFLT